MFDFLLYPNGKLQHAGMVKMPNFGWGHAFHLKDGNLPEAIESRDMWAVTGALFFIRRETLRKLGGYSIAFSLAYEDLDYCLNAWKNGVRVHYAGDVAAYHIEGGTRGATFQTKKNKSLLWLEREGRGAELCAAKWGYIRDLASPEELLPKVSQRRAA